MAVLDKVDVVVAKVEDYAQVLISGGAVALSALDPSTLPPKWAAGVVTANAGLAIAKRWLPKVEAAISTIEADASAAVAKAPTVVATVKADAVRAPSVIKKIIEAVKNPKTDLEAVLEAQKAIDALVANAQTQAAAGAGNPAVEIPAPKGPNES